MLLYNSAICDLLRESIQMMKWILLGNFSLSASKDHPPPKKNLFREFSNIEEVSQFVGKFTKCDNKICCGLSKLTTNFLIFFTKVCFFFKKIVKNTKKIRKNQMTSKTGCPPYNLLGNLFFGGLVFCWYFKYILPKLLFWELSAGQGRGERMGLPWKI